MKYRILGQTDLSVSEIGFGAWAIGGGAMIGNTAIGWGEADDEVSRKAIHAALDAGINFFDTADIYGLGHSEELIGELIGNRKDIVVATKCGNVSRNQKFTVDYTSAYLTGACEASLKRLKRESIEYYQLHTARLSHLQEGECVETMQRLQQQGKIRYWGLSLNTFNPLPEAEWLMERKLGFGFQAVLNIINQRALPLLQPAAQGGYGIVARMALQFGLLTGKFSTASFFQANDHRKGRLTADLIRHADLALSPVWDLCEKYNCSKTALSLSYVLSHPEVSTVIPGIRTREQVIDNTSHIFTFEAEDLVLIEGTLSSTMTGLMQEIEKLG